MEKMVLQSQIISLIRTPMRTSIFFRSSFSAMEKSEEEIILITDGGYDGPDNIALVKEENVRLVTTALIGKGVPDTLADFQFTEEGTKLLKYAVGYKLVSQSYTKSTRQFTVSFDGIIALTAHIRNNAAQRFIKKLQPLSPR